MLIQNSITIQNTSGTYLLTCITINSQVSQAAAPYVAKQTANRSDLSLSIQIQIQTQNSFHFFSTLKELQKSPLLQNVPNTRIPRDSLFFSHWLTFLFLFLIFCCFFSINKQSMNSVSLYFYGIFVINGGGYFYCSARFQTEGCLLFA